MSDETKSTKQGKATLVDQIANLKAKMTPAEIEISEKRSKDERESLISALAFKLKDRGWRKPASGLSKREQAFFDEMAVINPASAEEWKGKTLTAKASAPKKTRKSKKGATEATTQPAQTAPALAGTATATAPVSTGKKGK